MEVLGLKLSEAVSKALVTHQGLFHHKRRTIPCMLQHLMCWAWGLHQVLLARLVLLVRHLHKCKARMVRVLLRHQCLLQVLLQVLPGHRDQGTCLRKITIPMIE